MKRGWPLALLLLLVTGLLGTWVYRHLEKEQVVVTVPGSAEARRNPLLAAQRLLQRLGYPVASVSGSARLLSAPGPRDTLLLYANRTPLGADRLQRLLNWVAGGGNLVMDVDGLWDGNRQATRSSLLQRLGVQMVTLDAEADRVVQVPVEGGAPLEIALRQRYAMRDESGQARHLADVEGGSLLLRFAYGAGSILLASDLSFLDNHHIGEHDHAYLLTLLADPDHKTWLFFAPHVRSLVEILWQHAKPLWLSLAILGLAWLRHGNRRIAPPLPPPATGSRDLGEHLDALGRFERRHGLLPERVRQTQAQVERRWLLRHPPLAGLTQTARAEWIAERTGLAADGIAEALYGAPPGDAELTRHSARLQQLWQLA